MKKWLESELFETLSTITDLIFYNILFLLLSIPIFTYGAAKTALYEICLKLADKKPVHVSDYLHRFKNNLKQQMIPGLLFAIWFIIAAAAALLYGSNAVDSMITSAADKKTILILTLVSIYICCALNEKFFLFSAQFEGSFCQQISNAVRFSLAYPLRSTITAIMSALPAFLALLSLQTFVRAIFVFLLVYFSSVALIESFLMKPVIQELCKAHDER